MLGRELTPVDCSRRLTFGFYRAMLRCSAVMSWQVVRPSVCPSVTLRYADHIGWNASKIISRLINLGSFSLLGVPTSAICMVQREHPKIRVE